MTSIATTSPITGGTITTTGTLGCATCLVATVNPSTGLLRVAGSTQTATGAELSGDATTSGSNAVTVTGVNGATVTGTNGDLVLFGASNHLTDGGTAIPNGYTATTQAAGDATAKVATDAFVAGVNPAVAVLAASTSSQTGTYSNGTGGIGATFTITATGTYTLDGITINAIGQRVLLKNQSSAFQNGVYTATVVGTTGVSPVFTRATDYNQPSDINSTGAIPVTSGTVNTTTTWVITSTVTTVGTDSLTYAQFSVNPANVVQAVSPGAGLCHFAGSTQTCTSSAVVGADMTNATVTATQLAAQYSKGSCTELWGGSGTSFALTAGDDAIADNSCYNDSGVTRTITAVKARSDNASNTTTVNPTFGSAGTGTTICSGALTAGNSLAYSSTCTVSNASWTTGTGINPVMGGTLTGTSISMIIEYTY